MPNEPMDALGMLETDLTSVDTSFPVLEPAVLDFVISEMKPEPNKAGTGHNLNIILKTAQPARTRDGVTKPAGFPVRDTISLTKTEKYDPTQRLAQLKEAVFGDKTGAFGKPEQYIGKTVTARIKIESSEEYGDRNRVAAYVQRR